MSDKSQELTLQESQNIQNNAEENQNNFPYSDMERNEIIHREEINGTPFLLISTEDKHFIVFGMYRISDKYNSAEEALNSLTTQQWKIIINIIALMQDASKRIEEEKNKK